MSSLYYSSDRALSNGLDGSRANNVVVNDFTFIPTAGYEWDLHSIYAGYMSHFQQLEIQWYNEPWAHHFTSFNDFLKISWPTIVVTDTQSGEAHLVTHQSNISLFEEMLKDSYGAAIFLDMQRLCICVTPFEKGPKLLRKVSNIQDYNKMQSFFPAAVILSTKERVRQGDPAIIQQLWDSRDKTFLAIDFEWYERDHTICLEFGYCALRCGVLKLKGNWPPDNIHNYWFGHYIVSDYVGKFRNKYSETFPWNYDFGKSQVIPDVMLSRVVQALIDSLASVDSGATLNTLVLVAHGISGDLQRLEELNIVLPNNMLVLDTSKFEHQLFGDDKRGPMLNFKSGQPRQKGQILSLSNMARSLDIDLPCTYHNAGNDAFICLLSLQTLLEPDSVPQLTIKKDKQ